jgi:hypothetical protein
MDDATAWDTTDALPVPPPLSSSVSGCVGPVMRDSASRITEFFRVSGYRAGSRGDKLESC